MIEDLHTTASGVQSAIALEALVSAAFILINSKMGDLMGRKRAYVIGLLAYAVGALAMTVAQSLTAIIIFWAIIGGLGASLLLPAMQSLIHGNFTGPAQKRAYALTGASAAIAAAVGPLLGGFLTTYLSWRVGFGLEVVVILVILSQIRLVKDVPYTGPRQIDLVGAVLSVAGMGGLVLGILVWQEGGDYVGLLTGLGAVTLAALAFWLVRRKRRGKPTLLDPDLFRHLNFRIGISQQTLQQITLGGAMIVLPLFATRSRHRLPPRPGQLVPHASPPGHHSRSRHRRRRLRISGIPAVPYGPPLARTSGLCLRPSRRGVPR